jgi:ABC-type sugar transport system substrate-binding protein
MTEDDQNTSNNKGDGAPRRESIWGQFPVVNRRDFMAKSMLAGMSLPPTWGALSTPATAADAPWDPYPWKWGKNAIADSPDAALKWWLDQLTNSAVSDSDPSVVLTDAEISQLKSLKLPVGFSWYDLTVYAVEGWKKFWTQKVSEWASPDIVNFDQRGQPQREKEATQLMISQNLKVAGQMSFDWMLFNAFMNLYHEHGLATVGIVSPPSAYYPASVSCVSDDVTNFEALVKPICELMRSKGYTSIDAVWMVEASPSFWTGARRLGFENGIKKYESTCKINVVQDNVPVATPAAAQAAANQALQRYPNLHLFIMLAHQYLGCQAAVRAHDRRDVWVVASDLDEGTATALQSGGWPTYATVSLPIAPLSFASANVMGKLLLGKRVPLLVKSSGVVATPDNFAEAYSKMWNGEKLPWH